MGFFLRLGVVVCGVGVVLACGRGAVSTGVPIESAVQHARFDKAHTSFDAKVYASAVKGRTLVRRSLKSAQK